MVQTMDPTLSAKSADKGRAPGADKGGAPSSQTL